ncbi:tumor necrosis factor ligand superfamily member 15 isoform X1 [Hippocampus comes]|uniref:tumor necrosis factor ligand superfamily member 15 isoform X1 n=1 Tax=Hippocampus comes TaxID=109280 RepID=UPI00094E47AD|nr:PREDICTED: tumor necrosis factor ligand superfamily member 15-like isoform X1 [Hippocampus comes]XP_019716478.1 PREDICTED: tumor necrosis factor ligand superfamily member 15-like isoform X1 [Hippocampus comes]
MEQLSQRNARRTSRLGQVGTICAVHLSLFMLSTALLVLVLVVLRGGCSQSPASKSVVHGGSLSSALRSRPHKNKVEAAMLTAPHDKKTVEEYLLWESVNGNAHLHGGFRYSNGSLVIPTKGLYRVFLQLTYESNTESKFDLKLSNTVVLYHDSYPSDVTLLSSVDTVSHSTKQWSKSLHTSGIFLMKANSRLRVKSANANLISSEEHLVFFGAELLSQ